MIDFLLNPQHYPDVSIGATIKCIKRSFVCVAMMRSNGLLNAVKLDDDKPLHKTRLKGRVRFAARQKSPTTSHNSRARQFGVRGQFLLVINLTISGYPVWGVSDILCKRGFSC